MNQFQNAQCNQSKPPPVPTVSVKTECFTPTVNCFVQMEIGANLGVTHRFYSRADLMEFMNRLEQAGKVWDLIEKDNEADRFLKSVVTRQQLDSVIRETFGR